MALFEGYMRIRTTPYTDIVQPATAVFNASMVTYKTVKCR